MRKKNASVFCPVPVLFQIIEQDLTTGICCDIYFSIDKKKYRIGAWGDNGNTYANVKFYFKKQTFDSLQELKDNALLDNGQRLIDFSEDVLVTECDACYPRDTPILDYYYRKSNNE